MVTLYREEGDAFIVGEDAIIVSIEEIEEGRVKLCFSSSDRLTVSNQDVIPHVKPVRQSHEDEDIDPAPKL